MKKIVIIFGIMVLVSACNSGNNSTGETPPPTNESARTCSTDADCTTTSYGTIVTSTDDCGCMPFTSSCLGPVNLDEASAREEAYNTYCKSLEDEETPDECPREAYCDTSYDEAACVSGQCTLVQSE